MPVDSAVQSKTDKAEMKRRIRKARDQAPSMRQQSASYVSWKNQEELLGQPFDVTKIPFSKLYQMRRDPMLSFGMHFIKAPLVRAPWKIHCDDPAVAAFVDGALRRIYGRLILQFCLSFDFGFSAVVKRWELDQPSWTYLDTTSDDPNKREQPAWDNGNVEALVWKPFVALRPEKVWPKWTRGTGEFDGMDYETEGEVAWPSSPVYDDPKKRHVDLLHSLWFTSEKDSVFGSVYGYPLLGYAYRYWWSYWFNWGLADRAFEKDVDPATVVYHPNDEVINEATNERTTHAQTALEIGDGARSNSTVALPNSVMEALSDGKLSGMREWEVDFLKPTTDFEAMNQRFEYLDVMKLRSLMVPEQALLEGKGGTSSRNVATQMGDIFQESQSIRMAEIDDHINRYMIPQIVAVNFPEYKGKVEKRTRAFGDADFALAKQLVQLVGQSDPSQLEVDVREILEQANVPLLSKAQVDAARARIEEQLAREAAATAPPETPPTPGDVGVAATPESATGFSYVPPTQHVHLSEKLFPQSRHYEDGEVRDATIALRNVWRQHLGLQYEAFADWLEREDFSNLDLAEDPASSIAAKIVERWREEQARVVDVTKRTMDAIRGVISRAGLIELKSANLSADWDPAREDVARWIQRRAAGSVTGINETTRNQLRTFLASEIKANTPIKEIGNKMREHFNGFPATRAATIARTEVRDAYNAATLFAGEQAGVPTVQAYDASEGKDKGTDQECLDRDGRFYPLSEAFKEDEHPNGTLGWRLMPREVELSMEDEMRGGLARFDPATGTVHISRMASDSARRSFLDQIGRRIQAEGPDAANGNGLTPPSGGTRVD